MMCGKDMSFRLFFLREDGVERTFPLDYSF